MHSHFRVSWGYDTGMIQGSDTRQRREPRDTQFTEDQRAPHSQLTIHTSVSFGSLTVKPSSRVKASVFRLTSLTTHGDVSRIVQKTAVSQILHPKHKLLTSKNINHIMYEYCFLSFYIYLVRCIYLSILIWKNSHETDTAGEMSTIPLVPKLKTAEKSNTQKRERRNRGHQRIF